MKQNICQICGQKSATIQFKKMVNGVTEERYVCESCSGALLIGGIATPMNFFASLMKAGQQGGKSISNRECVCGISEKDLRKNLKFGCAQCYNTFADIVEKFLAINMPGVQSHRGKSPFRQEEAVRVRSAEEELREQLKQAVAAENYDLAAKLHKRIREL